MSSLSPKELGIRMTIRFEGLSPEQVLALHGAAKRTQTETLGCAGLVTEKGEGGTFIEVTKSELKHGFYTVLVSVFPELVGNVFPTLPGKTRQYGSVHPSRTGLGAIFDAVGILPEKERYVDRSNEDPTTAYLRR